MTLPNRTLTAAVLAGGAALLSGCGAPARLPIAAGIGPSPQLPAPSTSLIPLVQVAPAKGWPAGARPTPGAGLAVAPFATGLDHPRWLYVLPNGDVLVAETNGPKRPQNNPGLKGWFTDRFQKKAGSASMARGTGSRAVATQSSSFPS
jgi:glucose/arabinose dehydrogenase